MNGDHFSSTIESLYRTVTDDRAWDQVLKGLALAFDTPRASILRASASADEPYETRAFNFDDETQTLYSQYYWSKDPTVPIGKDSPVGAWKNCDALLDPNTKNAPEYVNDFAMRRGLRYVSGAKLHASEKSIVLFSVQRPADHRPFDDKSEEIFARFYPHLARSAALAEELRAARVAQGVSQAALDGVDWPILALSGEGRIQMANRAAAVQLAQRTPFHEKQGVLRSEDADLLVKLERALKSAAASQASIFHAKSRGTTWLIRVVPNSSFGVIALVYATCVDSKPPASGLLRQLLRFSEAEAAVASLLVDGYTVKEIAFTRQVSVNTVRAQVRSILEKAGVRRQTDLAKILLCVPQVSRKG